MSHTFTALLKHRGLPNDAMSIAAFLKLRRPLTTATRVEDAPFWSLSQRHFIKEQIDRISLALRHD